MCSSAAEECSDHCGSLLLLQLGIAPTSFCSISVVDRDMLFVRVQTAKRQPDCSIRFTVMGVTVSRHKNKGTNIDFIFMVFCQGLFLLRFVNEAEPVSQAKMKRPE